MAEDDQPAGPPAPEGAEDQAAPTAAGGDAEAPSAPNAPEPEQADAPEADAPAAPAEAVVPEPGDEAPSAPNAAPVDDEGEPAATEPAAAAEAAPEAAAAEASPEPAADVAPEGEPAATEPAAPVSSAAPDEPVGDASATETRRQRPPRDDDDAPAEAAEPVVPGAHLEPDLVLEESRPSGAVPADGEFDPYADTTASADDAEGEPAADADAAPKPAERTPLDLAADARYPATGKRKRAIARVILRPGTGVYAINGKALDTYFPRTTLQKTARLPLETAGYESRMDVHASIRGGGVSAQAIALRHGIARALVEADPNLRGELKRHGFLTRDARVKERKKAGLKKARKRPQFSKR